MERVRALLRQCIRPAVAGLFVALSSILPAGPAQAQTTLVVDADGRATTTDCGAHQRAFSKIQDAVDAAPPGSTIHICPGIYAEQVVVTKNNLTLRGAGVGLTVVRPSAVPATTTSLVLPVPVAPIVLVDGATGVTVARLTIDGGGADGGAANLRCDAVGFYAGLFYRNASGTVDSAQVTAVNSATRCSSAIRGESGAGGVANLLVKDNLLDRYGTFGLVCAGPRAACTVTGNRVRGRGPVNDQVQAGIAIRAGATAAISGNEVRDHYFTPTGGIGAIAVGIFLVNADPDANPHLLQDNTFINNELNVQRVSTEQAL